MAAQVHEPLYWRDELEDLRSAFKSSPFRRLFHCMRRFTDEQDNDRWPLYRADGDCVKAHDLANVTGIGDDKTIWTETFLNRRRWYLDSFTSRTGGETWNLVDAARSFGWHARNIGRLIIEEGFPARELGISEDTLSLEFDDEGRWLLAARDVLGKKWAPASKWIQYLEFEPRTQDDDFEERQGKDKLGLFKFEASWLDDAFDDSQLALGRMLKALSNLSNHVRTQPTQCEPVQPTETEGEKAECPSDQARTTDSATEISPEPTEAPRITIEKWSDLGIGLSAEGKYLAFTPCPETGALVSLSKGIELELRGARIAKVLRAFAGGDQKQAVRKSEIALTLGYLKGSDLDSSTAAEHGLERIQNTVGDRLRDAISDLARILRKQVGVTDLSCGPPIYQRGYDVKIRFVAKCLVTDEDRLYHFGQPLR